MKKIYLKISAVLLLTLVLCGCDQQNSFHSRAIHLVRPKSSITVWDRMANEFSFDTHSNNPRVQRFIKQYTRGNAQNLIKISNQAKPFIYHVVTMIEDRDMPTELALLPIIESEYKPFATSHRGASGIWQLASLTGRIYGLKQDQWADERKDVEAATIAALNYLDSLYERYDHDWLLALAAYNAGHGRVDQAIRANRRAGKPTDYWSLNLPKETQYFVPKFLALVHLVKNSHKVGIKLAPIPNKPYFAKVKLNAPIDLHKAAHLAKVDIKEVKHLNPSCRANTTHPRGPHKIILPVSNVSVFKANYVAKPSVTVTGSAKSSTAKNSNVKKVSTTKKSTSKSSSSKTKRT